MTPAQPEARAALAALLHIGGRLRVDGGKVTVQWNGPRDDALAARLRAVKPELRAMLLPLPDAAATARGMFNATVIEGAPELPHRPEDDWPLPRRLAAIADILNQRDARGRISYTRSQVDSCLIGLRSFAGQPGADAMLARLALAKKTALTAAVLAWRMSEG